MVKGILMLFSFDITMVPCLMVDVTIVNLDGNSCFITEIILLLFMLTLGCYIYHFNTLDNDTS